MAGIRFYGLLQMATARHVDENGFLLVRGCPLTSFGIFDYGAGQIGLPGDPNRIVKVFRPESAVSEPAFIESLKNIPLINDHEMLSGFQNDETSTAPEDKGVDGILTSNVAYNQPWTRGDLKVFSRSMQEALLNGKQDLSLGYSCEYIEKPGVWNGQPYEVIQTTMRGNHIALVGEGRVRGARVLDGLCFDHLSFDIVQSTKGEEPMSRKTRARAADSGAAEELKVVLPQLVQAFEKFLSEESTEPAHQGSEEPNAETQAAAQSDPAAEAASEQPQITESPEAGGGNEEGDNIDPAQAEQQGAEAVTQEQPNADVSGEQPAAGGDLAQMIAQAEAVIAKLKQVAGMGAAADDVEGLQEENAVEGARVPEQEGTTSEKVAADEGEPGAEAPLSSASDEGEPEAMGGKGEDAALRGFYADLARKNRTYGRVSALVGAFDHSSMDAHQVVVYGLKKFGLDAAKGTEQAVLDAYLSGVEKGRAKSTTPATKAMDAAASAAESQMDAYLKGSK